jgi:esterase/lipase superfamily enzyme
MYAVMVYIEKGADIWEVASYGWDKESQQKSVPAFEAILRTLKF